MERRITIEATTVVATYTRVEVTETETVKFSKVLYFGDGGSVCIPANQDGSIKWFDDTQLIRRGNR